MTNNVFSDSSNGLTSQSIVVEHTTQRVRTARGWSTTRVPITRQVETAGNSRAAVIYGKTLVLGGDTLQIDSQATARERFSSRSYGINKSNVTFSGRNVRINAYAEGNNPFAYGLADSNLKLTNKDGVDVQITATSRLSGVTVDPAWGIYRSKIETSSGADKIRVCADAGLLTTQINGAVGIESRGMEASSLDTGNGDDEISIEALSAARTTTGWLGRADAIGLDNNSLLSSGNGADRISILAKADGHEANAWGIRRSRLEAGMGDDDVTITATTTTEAPVTPRAVPRDPAWAMSQSSVDLGLGNDVLRLNSSATTRTVRDLKAFGTVASDIDGGEGNDLVEVQVRAAGGTNANRIEWGESYGLVDSTLKTGNGDDSFVLSVVGGTKAIGLERSSVLMGEGHDTSDIRVEAQGWRDRAITENVYGRVAVRNRFGRITGYETRVIGVRNVGTVQEDTGEGIAINNSRLETGAGDDSVYIAALGSKVSIAMKDSILETGAGNDVVVVEGQIINSKIDTDSGDDQVTLFGNGNATVNGGEGDDAISGGDGNDVLLGGIGNDALIGNAGNDSLNGGAGDDLIDGGTGNDVLLGGEGSDTFVLNSGEGHALVRDFQQGTDRVTFGDNTDLRMELRAQILDSTINDSHFFTGIDLMGVVVGVSLTAQADGSYA